MRDTIGYWRSPAQRPYASRASPAPNPNSKPQQSRDPTPSKEPRRRPHLSTTADMSPDLLAAIDYTHSTVFPPIKKAKH